MAQSSDAAGLAARSKMRRKLQVNAETIARRAKQTTKRRTLIDKKDAVLAGCVEEGVNGGEMEMGGEWRRECVRGVLSRPKKGPAQGEQQVAYLSCALQPLESSIRRVSRLLAGTWETDKPSIATSARHCVESRDQYIASYCSCLAGIRFGEDLAAPYHILST